MALDDDSQPTGQSLWATPPGPSALAGIDPDDYDPTAADTARLERRLRERLRPYKRGISPGTWHRVYGGRR